MRVLAESAVYGTAGTLDLLRETDPDVLLATQAVNAAAAEIVDEQHRRLAIHIISELAKAWK
ncbi:MAG: hypothetical protein ACXVXP_00460 [Mycobacteriaceae bacterium]